MIEVKNLMRYLECKPRGIEKLNISAETAKNPAKVRGGPMVKSENPTLVIRVCLNSL
jgi:hypothetical protein